MSLPPLIFRYVFREILTPFWITLFVFTGILFLGRSLKLVDLVVNRNVPASDMIILFSYIVPRFLEIALPMSLLLAVIVAFGRLSHDSELIVIRATGMSLKRLAVPVLLFSATVFAIAVLLSFWIRPWANHRLGVGMFEIAKTQASAGLVAGVFNEFGQLTIYAEGIEAHGEKLNNVIIGDRRDPEVNRIFIAQHGKILSDPWRRSLSLQLYDGSIAEGRGSNFTVTYFEINNISLPHSALLEERPAQGGKRASEMYVGELVSGINSLAGATERLDKEQRRELAKHQVELHKRLALPFSCLCVAVIAMALGIQPARGSQASSASASVGLGIGLILLYYFMFAVADAIGEQGIVPAWLAMWTPNGLFALLGLYLFERMGSEQWMAVSQALADTLGRLPAKLRLSSQRQTA
ncbi:MAG: LPS export ABC transporter permease LptF [Bdellovibrionales bacterium]|nr:LPS export ABC transporter permease LptF [Bdellovibrionales bacterium]